MFERNKLQLTIRPTGEKAGRKTLNEGETKTVETVKPANTDARKIEKQIVVRLIEGFAANTKKISISLATLLFLFLSIAGANAQAVTADVPAVRPTAIVDLRTSEGANLVSARWKYSDVKIVEADNRKPGADLRASGEPIKTNDINLHAGAANFDDSNWETVLPENLEARRGSGKLSFNWYRTSVTIPERIGNYATKGATVVFEIVVDDYSEIYVNGVTPVVLGQTGGGLIKGFNAPNRVVLTGDARAGETFQIAVFATNAPLSAPPTNFIWVRSATLDFYERGTIGRGQMFDLKIDKKDSALDKIISSDAKAERLATGFLFTEGPVWVSGGDYLLFSDPNANTIYRLTPKDGQVSVYRTKSGYSGFDVGEYKQPGSNGLTLDAEGRLVFAQHGNRRVVRLEKNGSLTVLADKFEGRRLNSPNDLIYRSDGVLYFTDPPFGLPKVFDDRRKELNFSGVYALVDGNLKLVSQDFAGPNGLAFSPDEKYLYVGDWDDQRKVVMRYAVQKNGDLTGGELFYDFTADKSENAIDGIKVDAAGNVYISAPNGLAILSPEGKLLGTIVLPEHPHNFAFGDADGKSLYLTAQTSVYRLRLNVEGVRPR